MHPVLATPIDTRASALEALYATGHWLLSRTRIDDAASVFRALALLAPEDERAWLALGACHEALAQTKLALDMYATGQALGGPAVRSRLARARVLVLLGRDDEALEAREGACEVATATGDDALITLAHDELRAS